MTDQQIQAIGRQYSQCVREHGVPDFPDLVLADGQLGLPDDATGTAGKQAMESNRAAQDACKSIMARLPASAQKNPPLTADDVRKLIRFSQCVREHGIPDWPDPGPDGVFPLAGTSLGTEGKSPRMIAAMQACKQYWDKGIRAKGPAK
jgi:hypothetical protein